MPCQLTWLKHTVGENNSINASGIIQYSAVFSADSRSFEFKGAGLAPLGPGRNKKGFNSVLRRHIASFAAVILSLGLVACESDGEETVYPDDDYRKTTGSMYKKPSSVFGEGGLGFGGNEEITPGAGAGGAGIGVNSYLWRATLDTVSFMPLASADPFGGVIITDWYTPPQTDGERFKINVFILGRDLRADGVKARVFRQERTIAGEWRDSNVGDQTPIDLENAILTRARQLRIAALQ